VPLEGAENLVSVPDTVNRQLRFLFGGRLEGAAVPVRENQRTPFREAPPELRCPRWTRSWSRFPVGWF